MSYGEIYILQNNDGSWLLEEDFLPGSLKEAKKWEAFGRHIGQKLTEIALLNQQISDETQPLPALTLIHSDTQKGKHSRLLSRSLRSPEYSRRSRVALAWRAIHADIRSMRHLLTEDREPKKTHFPGE